MIIIIISGGDDSGDDNCIAGDRFTDDTVYTVFSSELLPVFGLP